MIITDPFYRELKRSQNSGREFLAPCRGLQRSSGSSFDKKVTIIRLKSWPGRFEERRERLPFARVPARACPAEQISRIFDLINSFGPRLERRKINLPEESGQTRRKRSVQTKEIFYQLRPLWTLLSDPIESTLLSLCLSVSFSLGQ